MNVLFVTLDQFRADALSASGNTVVATPNLDALAARGTRFTKHFSQAAPCAPGRAALYTGTYQMHNRVVANGTPLDERFDNVALAARRAGYVPALFGYTDQGIDPAAASGPDDPWLDTYEGILPGFDPVLHLDGHQRAWIAWLRDQGFVVPDDGVDALATEPERPAEVSCSSFLTGALIDWIDEQRGPWFAHASFIRPHPPYAAAGHFATSVDPASVGLPIAPSSDRHVLHELALAVPASAAPTDPVALASMRAQYFAMVAEVDSQVGRLLDHLEVTGQLDHTLVIITADHGEQLGDHGLKEKLGFFPQSYHIPCLISGPGLAQGVVIDAFTENVDILPTLCELFDLEIPLQCDGTSLVPFLKGGEPERWRSAVHYEWDWRDLIVLTSPTVPSPQSLERCHLAAHVDDDVAYVHFGDGTSLAFDLTEDPTWRTPLVDVDRQLAAAEALLTWRATHLDRAHTAMLLGPQRRGRWPESLVAT